MSKYTYEEYIKNDCHPTGYNEPCKSYIFGQSTVDTLLDKISDLEAKLAESEKAEKMLVDDICELDEQIKNYELEISQLKQQLADTEEQNKRVLEKLDLIVRGNQDLEQKLAEKEKKQERTNKVVEQFQQRVKHFSEKDQDKISFCIEKLEKVGQEFSMRVSITDNNMDLLNEIIDNQIKALKEEK